MLDRLFKKNYPENNGIYNCLKNESFSDLIKKTEMETYSKRADTFEEEKMLNLSVAHQQILAPFLQYPKNSIFLELGGGDGRFAFYLMKNGYQVIESDIAFGSVQKVKSIAEKNNIPNGHYAVIDAETLPFKDNCLDGIFMVASLHHIPNAKKAIKEIARVLKPDGHFLILREPASWQYTIFGPIFKLMRTVLRKKNKNEISLADDETKGFSKKNLQKILSENFTNFNCKPVHYLGKFYNNFLILLDKFTCRKHVANSTFKKLLQLTDELIAKTPLLRNFPWDWDISCQKK